jgi:ribosomal protein S18 acetylase RimI-like enzyme
MNPQPRAYRGEEDLQAMHELLMAGTAAQTPMHYVHPGDVDWWLFYPPLDGELWDGLYVWDDPANPGRLLAWSLIVPGQTFDLVPQPELRATALAGEMVHWAEQKLIEETRRAGKDTISVFWVSEGDDFLNPWLQARGYALASRDVFMRCELDPLPEVACPDGFTVRSCHGLEEVEARARAQYGAFASTAPFDRYVERFARFMRSPAYDPERDVLAAAPDGRIGAFCIIWCDPRNRIGLFEPVGTHPDFQRRGLGKAVMREALQRLQAAGMQHAVLCTGADNLAAIRLYESVGFKVVDRIGFFKKQI